MAREILFRGKRTDNGKWVEGHHFKNENGTFIFTFPYHANYAGIDVMVKVDSDTIGQYTGLTDRKSKKIFEWDIVKHYNDAGHPGRFDIGVILWDEKECTFYRSSNESNDFCCIDRECVYEVIGNVFDNPEIATKPKCGECKCRDCFSKSECCPQCEGAIWGCEEYSETDIYKPDLPEGGAE